MHVSIQVINAFTKAGRGGNPAGVVLAADALSQPQMQAIARAAGFSETAFLLNDSDADYAIRFFTPVQEVDLCGHAMIGAFSLLRDLHRLTCGQYTVKTRAGLIRIDVIDQQTVMMSQPTPVFYETVDREKIAAALNITVSDMEAALPAQIVSTGLRDIMVPIRSRPVLDAIQPDFAKVAALSQAYQTIGFHLFTRDTCCQADCRNLAPLYGIPEEAATGTASGALACYLWQHGQLKPADAGRLVFTQGYAMHCPSEIKVSLSVCGSEIQAVAVGGAAGCPQEMTVQIPTESITKLTDR